MPITWSGTPSFFAAAIAAASSEIRPSLINTSRRAVGPAVREHAREIEHARSPFAQLSSSVVLEIRRCTQLAGREARAILRVERGEQRAHERTLDDVAVTARRRRAIEHEPAARRCMWRGGLGPTISAAANPAIVSISTQPSAGAFACQRTIRS